MSDLTTLVVVAGLSGAGKSTALNALEDVGFYCVDNIPSEVIGSAVQACVAEGIRRLALGVDVRVRRFLNEVVPAVELLTQSGRFEVTTLFLDATDEALVRRFSSTRRPHPLSTLSPQTGERGPLALLDGVTKEREHLAPLRAIATQIIDTTQLSVHELRRLLIERYGPGGEAGSRMHTRLVSFGFKYGPPVEADIVLDVRFIDNPFFVETLRPLTGLDEPVRQHVLKNPDTSGFLEKSASLLVYTLPRYEKEGKSYLTVAVGCTGGQHRSVVIAEQLAKQLRQVGRFSIDVVHRDITRARSASASLEPIPDFANGPHGFSDGNAS